MPTSTFYNLPEEKRNKILFAVKEEFARAAYTDVSINKIVQAAGIPRGSFYQYFSDKSDMLSYLLSDYQQQVIHRMRGKMQDSGGDLFSTFTDLLDFSLEFVTEQNTNRFCKNLFSDIKVMDGLISKHAKNEARNTLLKELSPFADRGCLNLRTENDFSDMVEILFSITRDAIAEAFLDLSSYASTRNRYIARLELIKRGFIKNKEITSHA